MKMSIYIAKRLFMSVFVLFGLSILIFSMSRLMPGDPARLALGNTAPEWKVQEYREYLHLNDPLYTQYFIWLNNVIHGDLGVSLVTKRGILTDIIDFFPATFELVCFSLIISITISVLVGVTAGRRANSWFDNIARIFSYLGISMPTFVWAILALFILSFMLNLTPGSGMLSLSLTRPPRITGLVTIDSLLTGNFRAFVDVLWHMLLPGSALAVATIAQHTRIIRTSIVENLRKDYIAAAVSYGLPERMINFKYLLKPSLIPEVSILGLDIAASMTGSFIVESIFNWPGFGRYGTIALLNKDLNAIIGSVMVVGIFFAFMNIIVDIIVSYLDPRIMLKA